MYLLLRISNASSLKKKKKNKNEETEPNSVIEIHHIELVHHVNFLLLLGERVYGILGMNAKMKNCIIQFDNPMLLFF